MMNELYKKLKFPDQVNIMGIDYKITMHKELREGGEHNRSLAGQIRYSDAEIRIVDSLDIQQKWQTLFHELLHGIFDANHLQSEEDSIDLIANGLMCAIFNSDWRLK